MNTKQLIQAIAIEDNCFKYANDTYEKLYNHPHNHKYRCFKDNDYDYVEDVELIKRLDILSFYCLDLNS